MIRVLLADDEQLTRQAVAALLGLEPDLFEVVADVDDGAKALLAIAEHRPDVGRPRSGNAHIGRPRGCFSSSPM